MGIPQFIKDQKEAMKRRRDQRMEREKENMRVELAKAKAQRASMEESAKLRADLAQEKAALREQRYSNSVFGRLSSMGGGQAPSGGGFGGFGGPSKPGGIFAGGEKKDNPSPFARGALGDSGPSTGGFSEHRGYGEGRKTELSTGGFAAHTGYGGGAPVEKKMEKKKKPQKITIVLDR